MQLELFFDFISPYAYLAWKRARVLSEVTIAPRPVLFAGLLKHWGQLGPAEIPPKREFTFRDVFRFARRHGIPMTLPATHPFNPLPALRIALGEKEAETQLRIIDAIFSLGWEKGGDIASAEQLTSALDAIGLEGERRVRASEDPASKEALRSATESAIGRGVFGVPTYFANGELFWGNDRLDDALERLQGRDPLEGAGVAEALAKLRADAERRR